MKIKNLRINGFGKIENKEIEFADGINVIKGNNESGKSTLLKFITSMLYGTSRNKNGKEISDYDRFKPWDREEYSGRLEYELDNGEKYEVYREFKRKSPKLYDKNKNEISKDYTIDANRGNLFFEEQTGVQEENFFASSVVEQENVKLSNNMKNAIIQKLSNMVSSGNENTSYKKAIDKINKKQLEEIGSNRSAGRPLNLIEKEIEKYSKEKAEIEIINDKKYQVENSKDTLNIDIEENKKILNLLRKQKVNLEKIQIEEEKGKLLEQSISRDKEELEKLKSEGNIHGQDIKKEIKTNKIGYGLCLLIALAIVVIALLIKKLPVIALAFVPIVVLIILINSDNKKKKKMQKDNRRINQERMLLDKETEKIEKECQEKEKELINKKEKIDNLRNQNENLIMTEFEGQLDTETIEDILSTRYEKIVEFIGEKEREQADYKVKQKTIELDNEDITKKLESLVDIDEKLEELNERKEELVELNNMYELVKEELEDAYQELREGITPEFISELNNIIETVTNGKYSNVFLDNENNILIETENGEYMPLYVLSTGTIDLIYLALRISAAKEISNEKMPIVLDESFTYYDTDRLTEIIKYISKLDNKQILLFTCSNREIEVLERESIQYNKIEL